MCSKHAGISERPWWDGVRTATSLTIPGSDFILVLEAYSARMVDDRGGPTHGSHPQQPAWLGFVQPRTSWTAMEKVIVIVDEHIAKLIDTHITEQLLWNNRL